MITLGDPGQNTGRKYRILVENKLRISFTNDNQQNTTFSHVLLILCKHPASCSYLFYYLLL